MFKPPDSYEDISIKLSEVLGEIGVNEHMILKRRRSRLMEETIVTIAHRLLGNPISIYLLGSQSEGTTTPGLQSDVDFLIGLNAASVIQDWSEWTPGTTLLLLIRDETTPPGYCLLQRLRPDVPLPNTEEEENHFVRDTRGNTLMKNTMIDAVLPEFRKRQGPAMSKQRQPGGTFDEDLVLAFPFNSVQARHRANFQEVRWCTEDMKRYMEGTKCFVVAIGNKVSENSEFEWRISTSLAERCIMFSLNITQIRCYILLKMILKSYIQPKFEGVISSFMCKNALLHSINNKHLSIWKEHNILNCLSYCLLTLYECLLNGNCPHFIIKENNLIAGRLSYQEKHELLKVMLNLIQNIGNILLLIKTDDLGIRLQMKLNMIPQEQYHLKSADEITELISGMLLYNNAKTIIELRNSILLKVTHERLETNIKFLFKYVSGYNRYHRHGNNWIKTACRLCSPLFCTSLGSLIASYNIQQNNAVSPQALDWFTVGISSDVASSRLKLASVYFCSGNLDRTAILLGDVRVKYNTEVVLPVCGCSGFDRRSLKDRFFTISRHLDEKAIRHTVAFCVSFLPCEINCVPHELQYEMFRSTEEDRLQRSEQDGWMDWAEVDSLPYLYFLQYKTFQHQQRYVDKQEALNNLAWAIGNERNLGHKETALNMLGQCMEQEYQQDYALYCYMLSLNIRKRNNAASIHICALLSKYFMNGRETYR